MTALNTKQWQKFLLLFKTDVANYFNYSSIIHIRANRKLSTSSSRLTSQELFLPSVRRRENDAGNATHRDQRAWSDGRQNSGRVSNHVAFSRSLGVWYTVYCLKLRLPSRTRMKAACLARASNPNLKSYKQLRQICFNVENFTESKVLKNELMDFR
jgi:hypothetical protein